jgi:hypothetical protein
MAVQWWRQGLRTGSDAGLKFADSRRAVLRLLGTAFRVPGRVCYVESSGWPAAQSGYRRSTGLERTELVVQRIKALLTSGELKAGSRLPPEELADRLTSAGPRSEPPSNAIGDGDHRARPGSEPTLQSRYRQSSTSRCSFMALINNTSTESSSRPADHRGRAGRDGGAARNLCRHRSAADGDRWDALHQGTTRRPSWGTICDSIRRWPAPPTTS